MDGCSPLTSRVAAARRRKRRRAPMALTMSRLSGSTTGGPLMHIRRKELRPLHDFVVFYRHVTVGFTF